jgi:hypothetical protein
MASIGVSYPFGMRDIKLTPLPSGSQVDLPAAVTVKVTEKVVSAELNGDDVIVAAHGFPVAVEWELSSGGISLDAWALMTGRTVTNSGTTPNRVDKLTVSGTDVYPYFKIYGKTQGVAGDDMHVKMFKCKVTSAPEGTFQNGQFYQTGVKGVGIDDGTNGIMQFVMNETATNLPGS